MKYSALSSKISTTSTSQPAQRLGQVLTERIRREKERILAKRGFPETKLLPFILRTFPEYKAGWFHELVCQHIDQFLDDVQFKRAPRLILTAPPQSGKSE